MDLFDKLKQVRISKRARRGAVLGLCLCAAAGLGTHLLLGGGAPVGCTPVSYTHLTLPTN